MPDVGRTPYPQISQRSASFSIASSAQKPAAKRRTALGIAGTDLETGRRLTYLQSMEANFFIENNVCSSSFFSWRFSRWKNARLHNSLISQARLLLSQVEQWELVKQLLFDSLKRERL